MDIDKVSTLIADNVFDRLEMENLHGAKVVSKGWVKEEAAKALENALKDGSCAMDRAIELMRDDIMVADNKRASQSFETFSWTNLGTQSGPVGQDASSPVSLTEQVKSIQQLVNLGDPEPEDFWFEIGPMRFSRTVGDTQYILTYQDVTGFWALDGGDKYKHFKAEGPAALDTASTIIDKWRSEGKSRVRAFKA